MGNLFDQLRNIRQVGVASALIASIVGAVVWLTASNLESGPKPGVVRPAKDPLSEEKTPAPVRLRRESPSVADADAHSTEDGLPDETINAWLGRASRDPSGTLEQVMAMEVPDQRQELLDWILSAWTADDRAPALDWLATAAPGLPQDRVAEVLDLLMGPWAAENAVAAMEWVDSSLNEPHQTQALQAIATSWSLADPDAMEAWILAQNGPRDFWIEELVQGLIMSAPRKAMEWTGRLSDGNGAKDLQQSILQSWLLNDPGAAAAYLDEHPSLVVETEPETGNAE